MTSLEKHILEIRHSTKKYILHVNQLLSRAKIDFSLHQTPTDFRQVIKQCLYFIAFLSGVKSHFHCQNKNTASSPRYLSEFHSLNKQLPCFIHLCLSPADLQQVSVGRRHMLFFFKYCRGNLSLLMSD